MRAPGAEPVRGRRLALAASGSTPHPLCREGVRSARRNSESVPPTHSRVFGNARNIGGSCRKVSLTRFLVPALGVGLLGDVRLRRAETIPPVQSLRFLPFPCRLPPATRPRPALWLVCNRRRAATTVCSRASRRTACVPASGESWHHCSSCQSSTFSLHRMCWLGAPAAPAGGTRRATPSESTAARSFTRRVRRLGHLSPVGACQQPSHGQHRDTCKVLGEVASWPRRGSRRRQQRGDENAAHNDHYQGRAGGGCGGGDARAGDQHAPRRRP